MQARAYWKAVTVDRSDLLDRFLGVLAENAVAFAIVGGQGVNAFVDPVVSLDLDLVVAARDVARLEPLLAQMFSVERFAYSVNVTAPGSDLRIQIQTDPRYAAYVDRAERRNVLGIELPVARVEDVLQGKIWAAEDATRRASKRQKDLADIARLIEAFPHLRDMVPDTLKQRLL